jgi:hypothetical protein
VRSWIASKESGPEDPALSYLQRRLVTPSLHAAICWSDGVVEHCKISNSKHQISGFQVSGVRCQERKTKKLKPETSVFETGKTIQL